MLMYAKVGHVTCDNASNNATMLTEFATHVGDNVNGQHNLFNPETDRIRYVSSLLTM